MKNTKNLNQKLRSIYHLAYIQRIVRGMLRAVWLGFLGISIGFAIEGLLKVNLPILIKWILAGSFGFIGFWNAVFPVVSLSRFVWRLDRFLGTKEQLSTAFQYQNVSQNPIVVGLQQDVERITPEVWRTVWKKGWKLTPDLDYFFISLAIFALVSLTNLPEVKLPTDYGIEIPSLKPERGESEIFQEGVFGLRKENILLSQQSRSSQIDYSNADSASELSDMEREKLTEALKELGKSLKESPLTQSLGEALEQGNLEQAGQMLDSAADQVNSLPPAIREQLSKTFEQSAQEMAEAGMETLAEQLKNSAKEIRNGNGDAAAEAIKQISKELNRIAQNTNQQRSPSGQTESLAGAGGGSGSQETEAHMGSPAQLERLFEVGDTLTFNTESEGIARVLQPGQVTSLPQGQTVGGSYNSQLRLQPTSFSGEIIPYPLMWTWLNEIKAYFFPR